MRPVTLIVEGFTCFREEQSVDFTDLDLFAIAGPTGAGKTSLLDAMVYALYGAVPRVGTTGVTEFMSLGADRMSVVFDFLMEGVHYRVTRVNYRNTRPTRAQLERVDGPEATHPLQDGVRDVNARVEEIVGLDYDSFVQAVLLPQGEFAKFLQEAPASRRKTLTRLLRLEVYGAIMKRANREASGLQTQIEQLRKTLADEYADATSEHLERAREVAEEAKKEAAEREKEAKAARDRAKELQEAFEKVEEAQTKRAVLTQLEAQREAREREEQVLDRADRAEPIRSWLERIEELAPQAKRAREQTGQAAKVLEGAAKQAEEADAALQQATKAVEEQVPGLEERLEAIRGVESLQTRRTSLADLLVEVGERPPEAIDVDEAAPAFDQGAVERLRNGQSAAVALRGKRADRQARKQAVAKLEEEAGVLAGQVQEASGKLADAKQARDAAKQELEDHQQALRDTEQAHRATLLREDLEPGEPCPVCAQRVDEVPEAEVPRGLDELRAQVDAAEQRLEALESELRKAELRHSSLGAKAEAYQKRLDDAREQLEGLDQAVQEGEQALAERLEGLLYGEGPVEERHRRALLQAALQQWRTFDAAIREAVGDADPTEEAERVEERIQELSEAAEEAQEQYQKLVAAHQEAQEKHSKHQNEAHNLEKQLDQARQQAGSMAEAEGFADLDEVRAALRPTEERSRLRKAVDAWKRQLHAAQDAVQEIEDELGDLEDIDQEQVEAAQTAATQASEAHTKAVEAAARASSRAEDLADKVERATAKRARLGELRTQHELYAALGRHLTSDRFQDYLLQQTFREIVAGASARLEDLTGRYSMVYEDDGFIVVDHDNARERRSADTLSGGETFMASLCLALQLSEQIQQAKGAIRLDSLFIDEGFGTLDGETLDTVTDAIQTLGDGERMVGLITHVRELTERMPARVQVSREAGTARVVVEHEL